MSDKLVVYAIELSPPCRAVWMLLKELKIPFEWKSVNVLKGEQNTPEYLKMNPYHCVPTIDDKGFILWESRTIMRYVVDKFAKDDSMYPKDPQKRALVDRILDFELGTSYGKMGAFVAPQVFGGQGPDAKLQEAYEKVLDMLDKELDGKIYLAGDKLTIADLSMLSSLTFAHNAGFQYNKWKNISAWLDRCKKIPSYEPCFTPGYKIAQDLIASKKK